MGEARWRREDRGEELVGVREAARRRENREGAQSGRSGAAWVDTVAIGRCSFTDANGRSRCLEGKTQERQATTCRLNIVV